MALTVCYKRMLWAIIALSTCIHACEKPSKIDKTPELTDTELIDKMERIEQLTTGPKQEFSVVSDRVSPENYFLRLPAEIVAQILDEVLLFKDQIAFMLCAKSYRRFAENIRQTYIYSLREPDRESATENVISSMQRLKYLCITNCHMPRARFTSTQLTALRVRWSNIDPSLLTQQRSLVYLDLRTMNKSYISDKSFSYLGLGAAPPIRRVFSYADPTVVATLSDNPGLHILKLNITDETTVDSSNIYENLSRLDSLELVDLNKNQNHVQLLASVTSLQTIVISSYETGLMEGTYRPALEKLALLPSHKTVIIQCLNPMQRTQIVYTCQKLKEITQEVAHVM